MPPDNKLNKYLGGMKRTSKKLKASKPKRYVVLEYDIRKDMFVFQNMHRPSKFINPNFRRGKKFSRCQWTFSGF